MKIMRVRDGFAEIEKDDTVFEARSGDIEIIADDNHALFSIRFFENGAISVSAGNFCKHGGKMFGSAIKISPVASNMVYIERIPYNE